jgi:hypothetical protein
LDAALLVNAITKLVYGSCRQQKYSQGIAVGRLEGDNTKAVREYLGALRPWVVVLVLMAYLAPLVAAIAYDRTLSARDSMLFWLGSGSYPLFGLVSLTLVWLCHASLYAITRFARLRALVLDKGADHFAFDRRSRDSFIIASVLLVLYSSFCAISKARESRPHVMSET